MEILNNCPVCGQTSFVLYAKCQDKLVSQDFFEIQKCNSCAFLFTNPRPNKDEIGPYYQSEEYFSHSTESKSIISKIYNKVRDINIRSKVNLVKNELNDVESILDYGCGVGLFLKQCKIDGLKVQGVEPSDEAREIASEYSIPVIDPDELSTISGQSFDAISLWHVLEHIHNLDEKFNEVVKLLSPSGKMFIALPNPDSWDATHYGASWAAFDVPRHLYHFTKPTFKKFIAKYGMKIVGIQPMKFDAFYVSLLSEDNSIMKYPNAFLKGFISNLKAGSSMNYSSLIYILERQ